VRRNILLALIAALALTVGLSNVAAADLGGADASAKAGKKGKRGKGKACKGKSRGKARRSADAGAKARKGRKGKGKRRGCKGGGANWLEPGRYEGQGGLVSVAILSRTRVSFGAETVCPIALGIEVEDAKVSANKLTAGYTAQPGEKVGILKRMSLVVTSDYRYKLVVEPSDLGANFSCKPRATFEGKLKKVG
jgi:hypothetical protein